MEFFMSNRSLLDIRCVKHKTKFSMRHSIQLRKGIQHKINITKRVSTCSTKVYSHKPSGDFFETQYKIDDTPETRSHNAATNKNLIGCQTTTVERSKRIVCSKNWHANLANTIRFSNLTSTPTMQSNWWPITLTPTVPWDLTTSLSCRPFSKMWSDQRKRLIIVNSWSIECWTFISFL